MRKKTIVLVRHGQYKPKSEKGEEQLTLLGRKQATYVARRLKEYKINRIIHSTMPRAVETAEIIKKEIGYKKTFLKSDSLRECLPQAPKYIQKKFRGRAAKSYKRDSLQLTRAFKKYFKISKGPKESVDVLVCHGNVIRHLVCQFLGVNTLLWPRLDILQCSISTFELRSKGHNRKILLSYNDVGHIPKASRTFI